MNRRGKLLQLRVKASHRNDIKPKFIQKRDAASVNSIDFEFDDTESEFVFVGDFVFWTTLNLEKVQFVKVPFLKSFFLTNVKVLEPKSIEFKKYFGSVFDHGFPGIAIDACEPSVAARMS